MKSFFRCALPFVCILLISSCGALKKGPRYPLEVDAAMQKEFNAAEAEYKRQNWDQALEKYRHYRESYASNKLADEATYKMGKIYFLKKEWKKAAGAWVELAKTSPDPSYRAKGYLMASYSSVKDQDNAAANLWLSKVEENLLPAKLKLRLYWLAVTVGEAIGTPKSDQDYAFLRLADVYHSSADPSLGDLGGEDLFSKKEVQQKLESWVVTPIQADRIPSWLRSYPSGYAKPYVEYKLGKIYFEAGEREKARTQLSRYVKAYPTHLYVSSANRLLTELGGAIDVAASGERVKIGVLLPLSGVQASYGEAVLRGIRCGSGQLDSCAVSFASNPLFQEKKIQLILKDSNLDPENVGSLVNQLEEEGAQAVIGPMSASLAQKAAERAVQAKVVLLPITQKSGFMQTGDFIFQMGFPSDAQAYALVKEALSRGLKKFAVFYPNNPYGQEMAEFFAKEAASQGGKIAVSQSYSPDSPSLAEAIRSLKLHITHFSGTSGPGFDAVFIPDTYARINFIAQQLNESGIHDIPLMGSNTWNDPKLGSEFITLFPGSFFVDLFFPGANRLSEQFVQGYQSATGARPSNLEALGFDAIWFLRQAMLSSENLKGAKLRDALLALSNLEGVTGISSFVVSQGPVVKPLLLKPTETGIDLAK